MVYFQSCWICRQRFQGTLISIYSKNMCRGSCVYVLCRHVIGLLCDCMGYRQYILYMAGVFCSAFAWITWYAKEKTFVSKIISVGILMFMALISVIIFDGPRFYDFIIDGLLIYFLFIKRVNR